MPKIPLNKKLYEQVKKDSNSVFKEKTSAYKSMWIVREYKKRGGKYKQQGDISRLEQWLDEKWIDVAQFLKGKTVSCGRNPNEKRKKAYCRPSVRVNKNTPKTVHEIPKAKLRELVKKKKRNPDKRMKRQN